MRQRVRFCITNAVGFPHGVCYVFFSAAMVVVAAATVVIIAVDGEDNHSGDEDGPEIIISVVVHHKKASLKLQGIRDPSAHCYLMRKSRDV